MPMTESEWLACTDPSPMLEFLWPQISSRKLRLWRVAVVRRIAVLLQCEDLQLLVETAERSSDGRASVQELESAWQSIRTTRLRESLYGQYINDLTSARANAVAATQELIYTDYPTCATAAVPDGAVRAAEWAARAECQHFTRDTYRDLTWTVAKIAGATERRAQADCIRDIFGVLSFRPVTSDLCWLTSTVELLASSIYQERAFDRLPILSDALIDAGCNNEDILSHCRSSGDHCRGCWVVDLVLGKK